MSNRLSMAKINSIEALHASGHSNRQIAKLLGINRKTVNRYVRQLKKVAGQKGPVTGPNLQTESSNDSAQNGPNLQPEMGQLAADLQDQPKPKSGPTSQCDPYRETILAKVDQGLSAKRIHQDLKSDHGFEGSYHSVRRFILRLGKKTPVPFRRMEVEPGEEAQIDFGTGAPVIGPDGKKRRPWMLRVILSHSRKGYSEVVWRQTTDNFIAAIENAFYHFGGVPKRLVIDMSAEPTGTIPRSIRNFNRSPCTMAPRSFPPKLTLPSTKAKSKAV